MQKRLRILVISSGFMFFAYGLFGPLYAVYVQEIGGDLLTAGTAYSIYAIMAGVAVYLLSKWENRSQYIERFIIASYAIRTIGFASYLFITEPIHLFAVQLLFGLAEAVGAPAFDGLYSSLLDHDRNVADWGVWESMTWIVTGISAVVGGFMATLFGFTAVFATMALFALIATIVALLLHLRR